MKSYSKKINCKEKIKLIEQNASQLSNINPQYIKWALTECIKTASDFILFLENYGDSDFETKNYASKKFVNNSIIGCEVLKLFQEHPQICKEYKNTFFQAAVNCIETVNDCQNVGKVYGKKEDIDFILMETKGRFNNEQIFEITQQPAFNEYKELFKDVLYHKIDNLNDVESYSNRFPDMKQ